MEIKLCTRHYKCVASERIYTYSLATNQPINKCKKKEITSKKWVQFLFVSRMPTMPKSPDDDVGKPKTA